MSGDPVGAELRGRRSHPGWTLDVELTFATGATTALVGPNGAGKSTVVHLLAGLLRLDDGHAAIDGVAVDTPAEGRFVHAHDRDVGVVFQDGRLFAHLDVIDNVGFGPRSRGHSTADSRQVAGAWLERLGLEPLRHRRPAELSGGQAQQVAIARAFASHPRLVLFDEPMSALDVTTRAEVRRWLHRHLADIDGARILVTHDPRDAFLLADHLVVLEHGAVTATGSPAELRARPRTPYAAAVVGINLLTGIAHDGDLTTEDGFVIRTATSSLRGPAVATIAPHAVALHLDEPGGSPRNTWRSTVRSVEPLGDTVRLLLATPSALAVDLTPAAVAALELAPGRAVWASVKATEVAVAPA